jgi:diketogulonate reductase-like aldo/keto reductase
MSKNSPQLQTKSGKAVHPIGIGTWNIASHFDPENMGSKYRGVEPVHGSEEREIAALRYSLEKGQNHLDCAEMYGGFYTDEVVGQAIKGFKREDLYIADKLWKTSVATGKVAATVEAMLRKLGTDYLDLLYIHAPFADAPWREAIPQIDELIDKGVVRHLGVSNFTVADMQEVMRLAKHPITANQMNYNVLYKDEVGPAFRAFCQENNIHIVAYQPIKRQEVLHNKTVQAIAEAHHATPAQVALAWLLQTGVLPIPKATTQAHIDENIQAIELSLNAEEIAQLDAL